MSGLQGKRWYFFDWDEDNILHLWSHRIECWEAEELFFNSYIITPNKKSHGPKRYKINGTTDAGRKLTVIFQDLGSCKARIITGWDM